jgi:hypothetical protein
MLAGAMPSVEERLVGRESVVDCCRIRVLGREPVVDRAGPGLRPPADLRGQVGGEGGVPHHVHARVEVENHVARLDAVDRDLGGRHAAQRALGHGHVRWQGLRREQLPEQAPLLVDIAVGGEGRLAQDRIEGLSLLGAH